MATLQSDIDFLEHYGVKGQKWGVRRTDKKATRAVKKADKKYIKNVSSRKAMMEVNNETVTRLNAPNSAMHKINKKKEYQYLDMRVDSPTRQKYYNEHETVFSNELNKVATEKFGSSPSGKFETVVGLAGSGQGSGRPVIMVFERTVKHVDDASFEIDLVLDSLGHIVKYGSVKAPLGDFTDEITQSGVIEDDFEFLEHYGVKGQKWGVRNNRPSGVARSINRTAKKDASEFVRAKLYYGDGAGTRRKLIKAKVEKRSKNPGYKKSVRQPS